MRTARTCAAAEQQYSKVVDLLLTCCVEGVHTALAVVEHNGLREKQFMPYLLQQPVRRVAAMRLIRESVQHTGRS